VQQQLFSLDNHTLAVGFDNSTIRVFDVSVANEQTSLILNDGRRGDIAFAFHPDGDSLMIAITSDDATDGKTELYHWDLESPQTDLITTLNASYISAMSFNPDGTLLVLGGSFENGGIAFFDPTTKEIVAEIGSQRQIARELRFSPDGGVLFSIGNDNFVRVWGFAE
jgi:WD40 repeat protein